MLTNGPELGQAVAVPESNWHPQAVPHFDYLLHDPAPAVMLAGGHGVPVQLPDALRMAWHKLYSSTRRTADRTKAENDLWQAAVLLAVLVERDGVDLRASLAQAPAPVRQAVKLRTAALVRGLAAHPQGQEAVRDAVECDAWRGRHARTIVARGANVLGRDSSPVPPPTPPRRAP
jgi:hypothetical protein